MNAWLEWLGGLLVGDGGIQAETDCPNLQEENDALRKEISDMRLCHAEERDRMSRSFNEVASKLRFTELDAADCKSKVDAAMIHLLKIKFGENGHVNN